MATSPALMAYLKSLGIDTSKVTDQPQLQQPDYGLLGAGVGGLMDLYSGGKVADAYGSSASSAEDQANQLQQQMQQMPTLASMYGADSPYAKQLAATLQAKDAAAGRNSQYGNRAVQLQAMLADKGSQYATAQAQMANQYNAARTAANAARAQATNAQQGVYAKVLGNMFGLADKTGYLQQGNNYLKQMFNPDQPAPTQEQVNTYSQGGPSTGLYGTQPEQPYQSNGGMGEMYGAPATNYAPGMDTTQAPTSANNSYAMDDWMYQ